MFDRPLALAILYPAIRWLPADKVLGTSPWRVYLLR